LLCNNCECLVSGITVAVRSRMKTRSPMSSRTMATLCLLPLCLAAKGDGCSASSRSPAPDVTGEWAIAYDDLLDVTIRIGGTSYDAQVGAAGGVVEVEHGGQNL